MDLIYVYKYSTLHHELRISANYEWFQIIVRVNLKPPWLYLHLRTVTAVVTNS